MKRFLALLLAVMMLMSLMVSVSAAAAEDDEPVYGGDMTIYFRNLMTEYDPSGPDIFNYAAWYEPLFVLDWSKTDDTFSYLNMENMKGQLAESWEWNEEDMTLTVTIRDDVYFQTLPEEYDYYGGRKLTAADVEWSYDRLLGIGASDEPVFSMMDWPGTLYMIRDIDVVDDTTLVFYFNTDKELAINDFIVNSPNIVGPEWADLTAEQRADWHYCCGTGPFIIQDYVEGSAMTLVRNDNYYGCDERHPENKLPYLDSITLLKTMDNATLMAEFLSGEVSMVVDSEDVFTASEQEQIRNSMKAEDFVEYSNRISSRCLIMKQTIEPLTHPEVRQALQYAIDLDSIASQYFQQEDWFVPGMFSQVTPFSEVDWSDGLYESYTTYDPDLARQLLAEAGYPNGFEMNMAFAQESASATEIILLVQQYLAQVGVTLNIEYLANGPTVTNFVAQDNDYMGVIQMGNFRVGSVMEWWKSDGFMYLLWGDQEKVDALCAAVKNAETLDELQQAYFDLSQYVLEQHYCVYFTPAEDINYFVRSNVGGYNGENLSNAWNMRTIMARVWDKTAD